MSCAGTQVAPLEPVRNPSIVVLEDERRDIDAIRSELFTFSNRVRFVETYHDFVQAVETSEFDAASIDCYIGEHQKGQEALQLLRRKRPNAARIVLTHDAQLLPKLRPFADMVLLKGNMDEYSSVMSDAVRLGRARRIAHGLRQLGVEPGIASASLVLPVEPVQEEVIRENARAALRSLLISSGSAPELRELLVTSGWWSDFDVRLYIEMSAKEKLRTLIKYAGVTTEEFASILSISSALAEKFMSGEESDGWGLRPMAAERADQLLSVLAYVTRISDYEIELIADFWRMRHLFADSTEPPPWDNYGLGSFLLLGPDSLEACLTWIRTH